MFIIHATCHVWYCRKNVNSKPEKNNQERAAKYNLPSLLSHLGFLFTPALNSRLLVLCVCTYLHLKWFFLKKRESLVVNSSQHIKQSCDALVANVLVRVPCAHAVLLLPVVSPDSLLCRNYCRNARGDCRKCDSSSEITQPLSAF